MELLSIEKKDYDLIILGIQTKEIISLIKFYRKLEIWSGTSDKLIEKVALMSVRFNVRSKTIIAK